MLNLGKKKAKQVRPYIYTEFSKKIFSYYFIDVCSFLSRPNLKPEEFINL